MNLNPVGLLIHPRGAVRAAYEHPSNWKALVAILLVSVFLLISNVAFNLTADLLHPTFLSIVGWILFSLLFYFIAYLLRGKERVSGRFSGITSALSLVWLALGIASIFVLAALYFMTPLLTVLSVSKEHLAPDQAYLLLKNFRDGDEQGVEKVLAQSGVPEDVRASVMAQFRASGGQLLDVTAVLGLLAIAVFLGLYAFLFIPYLTISELVRDGSTLHFLLFAVFWLGPTLGIPVLFVLSAL